MRGNEDIEARIAKSRRGSVDGRNNDAVQRAAGDYIKRYIDPFRRDFLVAKERLELLIGIRGERSDQAVRFKDLPPIRGIELESSLVSAAPTQSEHNALVRDVRRIRNALDKMR